MKSSQSPVDLVLPVYNEASHVCPVLDEVARQILFDLLDPMASRLMGPHINRRTLDNIRRAGLVVVEERTVFSDWIKVIVAR